MERRDRESCEMTIVGGPPTVSPPTEWLVTSDGAAIPYRIKGNGPALVMVHGWSQSGAMFQHQLDLLSGRFTVIVPDVRGHGEAPDPGRGYRMARLGQDLAELVDHLGLSHFNLLGWSMGASIAWAYIDLFGTSRIGKLILVDQPSMLLILPGMSEVEISQGGALFTPSQLGDLHAALCGREGEAQRAGFVAGMVTKSIPQPLFDWILAENAKTPAKVAADFLVSHCTHDWRDVLDRIDRPTLVIGGSASHVDPRSQRYIHSRIAASRYHEFSADEGGAHFPFLESPQAFAEVVGGFLALS
jgi:pimeloyl-ACP methyl ester carboxylesterase